MPSDVAIVMKQGTPYYQTDESVLGSLLCFDPDAPRITDKYKPNGSVDKTRYYAHFAYNPKPWQIWNSYSSRWRNEVYSTIDWLVTEGFVKTNEIPLSLRRSWWPMFRILSPASPWVWRIMKLRRRLLKS